MQFFAGVKADHRAQVGIADAALVVVGAVLDVQAHVVERQQGVKTQIAAEYLLLGDPDKARCQGGDSQVDVGSLVTAVVAQAVGQVITDEELGVGAWRRQDAHAVDFDAIGPGRNAAFGGMGVQGAGAQEQAGGEVARGAFEHERSALLL
ncbi:hypothetical protein D3C77_503690 [compost metagenome]